MTSRSTKNERAAVGIAAAIILLLLLLQICGNGRKKELPHIRCAIELGKLDDTTSGLLTGYNYYLLERYAQDKSATLDISLSRKGDSYIDSLKSGSIDLLVIPYSDRSLHDSVLTSIAVDSISVWLVPHSDRHRQKMLNKWIDTWHSSEEFTTVRERFLKTYDPLKKARAGKKSDWICPYDEYIREAADSIGWDWRMLAAVIYQESRFKIDARSRRGATGLMQMMPSTAEFINSGDIINPRTSIMAGSTYLNTLHKRYRRVAADKDERIKFTLAAYNAGAGRMTDVLNYAAYSGITSGKWEDICRIIPEMNDDLRMSTLDTVKLGAFKGVETINYVDRVISLYGAFKKICPEKTDINKNQ